ncbi:MAG: isoprenylcysteine carboxylmethyltransferase family protein [Pseudomonadota bacterium]|nr:isoprenylcysteine carboxylmethyltransferase family protein [Pseudomonadota bacterium]
MTGQRAALCPIVRWLKSTSNRTFVVWPLALLAWQIAIDRGAPQFNPLALPLLAWGYAQYRWVGALRARHGGGGPGLSNPPERLVVNGPYRLTRNPMYLGHLIFFVGLAIGFSGVAWVVLTAHALWFDQRVRADERHLVVQFGAPYQAYVERVRRWLPGLY